MKDLDQFQIGAPEIKQQPQLSGSAGIGPVGGVGFQESHRYQLLRLRRINVQRRSAFALSLAGVNRVCSYEMDHENY